MKLSWEQKAYVKAVYEAELRLKQLIHHRQRLAHELERLYTMEQGFEAAHHVARQWREALQQHSELPGVEVTLEQMAVAEGMAWMPVSASGRYMELGAWRRGRHSDQNVNSEEINDQTDSPAG